MHSTATAEGSPAAPLASSGQTCTLPGMDRYISPLVILRLGSPGQPSCRAIAEKMKLSPNAVSMFEMGRTALSDDNMKSYAKQVGSTLKEVRARWLQARMSYHERELRKLRKNLVEETGAGRKGRHIGSRS